MLTMKFGGTSVGDTERLREVVTIVRSHRSRRLVLVASAMSGVTNLLLETAQIAVQRDRTRVAQNVETIKRRHLDAVEALLRDPERRDRLIRDHERLIGELANLYYGVGLLKELTARSLDAIASFGEVLSCSQISEILADHDIPSEFVDARKIIRTDSQFGEAAVDFAATDGNVRDLLLPILDRSVVPVVTGFIASTEDGLTTTLGRSGSDYTASILGAALGCEEIWIWTDVDGVMTADPHHVNGAIVLPAISYREAAEMSYFGAKVIHPKTMVPAIADNIPIRIKNTFNPSHAGTLISATTDLTKRVVKAVTSIDNLSLVSIEGNGMIGVPGVSARIFSALARGRANVMMISQSSSEHNICVVIPQKDCSGAIRELRSELAADISRKAVDDIKVMDDICIVAVVGEGMRGTPGIAGRIFTAVAKAGINVVAIAQGSSELNVSLVVKRAEERKAVQAIHDSFHLA